MTCALLRPTGSSPTPDPGQSDYGGHDIVHHDQLLAYVGQGFGISPTIQYQGHVDQFYNNKVIMTVRRGGVTVRACFHHQKYGLPQSPSPLVLYR